MKSMGRVAYLRYRALLLVCRVLGHRWGPLQPTIVEGGLLPGYVCTRCEKAFRFQERA